MKYILSSIFDKDSDGFLSTEEIMKILSKSGEKISHQELLEMVQESDGCMDYRGLSILTAYYDLH